MKRRKVFGKASPKKPAATAGVKTQKNITKDDITKHIFDLANCLVCPRHTSDKIRRAEIHWCCHHDASTGQWIYRRIRPGWSSAMCMEIFLDKMEEENNRKKKLYARRDEIAERAAKRKEKRNKIDF